jgi:hypothetical protein
MEVNMAVRFRLGSYTPVEGDPLGRSSVGFFPRMTEEEAWEAGRGCWKMSAEKLPRVRFALVVAEGAVRAVAEVMDFTAHGDRVALEGSLLGAGHPMYDAYIGQPDPVDNGSMNPVGYVALPEEQQFLMRACACGCGATSERDFLPGHETRAIMDRVREHFDGNPLKFVQWIDNTLASAAIVSGRQPS